MDEPQVETEVADNEAQRRSGPWKLISVVVVLTLIGIWLVPSEPPEHTDGLTERQATDVGVPAPSLLEEGPEDATDDPSTDLEATASGARDGRPGSRARSLIAGLRSKGTDDLDAVHAAAVDAQARGETADAYLLYFFAAREGHAASAMALAMQADPASRNPTDSVFEDGDFNQAHKWYQVAARNGDERGLERLGDLRRRVDELAASGDPQAQRLSLLWQ